MMQVVSDMVFNTGFVHCDLHPGNVLVRPRPPPPPPRCMSWSWPWSWWGWGGGRPTPQVVLLDAGLCCQLSPSCKTAYARLWRAIFSDDRIGIRYANGRWYRAYSLIILLIILLIPFKRNVWIVLHSALASKRKGKRTKGRGSERKQKEANESKRKPMKGKGIEAKDKIISLGKIFTRCQVMRFFMK
jgi:hypothetical protein